VSDVHDAPDPAPSKTVALVVGAGGVCAFVAGSVLGSRLLRLAGLIATLVGGGLYARSRMAVRRAKIESAEREIRSELDALDPVARAQVLADLAKSPPF